MIEQKKNAQFKTHIFLQLDTARQTDRKINLIMNIELFILYTFDLHHNLEQSQLTNRQQNETMGHSHQQKLSTTFEKL